MWGNYWLRVGRWPQENRLGAHEDLPEAFWSSGSGWHCLDATVDKVARAPTRTTSSG
jgi:deoxyribodipyrimidine photolyase-like uncharacterized protein